MSKEPTIFQEEFAEKIYEAWRKYLHDNIEAIYTDPLQRSVAVNVIAHALETFTELNFITDEQKQLLVIYLDGALEHEITNKILNENEKE